MIKWYTEIT